MTDYNPTTWVNETAPAINATNLNKIENGIDTSHSELTTHEADAANPHAVSKSQVGLSNVGDIKVKLDAVIAPTVGDDSSAGYSVQSRWTDISADKEYVCLDATVGAAVWTEITGGGGGVTVHAIGGAEHTADTLANLNGKVTDATLIDTADSRLSDARDPNAHDHPAAEITDFDVEVGNNTVVVANTAKTSYTDAVKVATIEEGAEVNNINDDDATDLTDTGYCAIHKHIPETHTIGGSTHLAGTLASLNGKISDATLIDTGDSRLSDNRDPNAHNQAASTITDFDVEVGNNAAVTANTAKATNATHTGEVTGDGALTADKTLVTNKVVVTAVGADHVLLADASDAGNLKRALISDFASAGGDMSAATYDPDTIAGDAFDMDNMVESATNKILTSAERTKLGTIEESADVNNISDVNATDLTDGGETALHTHSGGGMSNHDLGGTYHVADTLSNLNGKITDATLIDTGDSRLSDARDPNAHTVASHSDTTVTGAELNTIKTDVDLGKATPDVSTSIDVNSSLQHDLTLSSNPTISVANAINGDIFAINLIQDATGSRGVTWFAGIKWEDGTVPTLTTAANKTDSFIFRCTGTGAYLGYVLGQNL